MGSLVNAPEPPFTLVDTARAHFDAQQAFTALAKRLSGSLPLGHEIRHIGATAIPNCVTKGDLDIVVRVSAEFFAQADRTLAAQFSRNEGSVRLETFSAFEDASSVPPLGVQLTTIGGPLDDFHLFVEALRQSPDLVEQYNALKIQHNGVDMSIYRQAKAAFIEQVLAVYISRD